MRASTLVITNPASARARRAWPSIREALDKHRITFDRHETTRAGDATERTRAALREGYEMIAVVGGDGTLSEAASGFFEFQSHEDEAAFLPPVQINARAALSILPAGTGDDFARGLSVGR